MSEMLNRISYYFSFPFVRHALIVGVAVSLCAAIIGVTLVLKRYSFIGDGLSHVAFGAVAVASVANLTDNTWLIILLTVVAAVFLLRTGNNSSTKGDAQIAMLSVGALAVGYMLLHAFSASSNISGDVCSTLFGSTSIISLQKKDVLFSCILSGIVLVLLILLYNRIFAVTFDENFARATGIKAEIYNLLLAVIIALIIVMGMKFVGSLLISALIVFPSLTAMKLMQSFKQVVIASAAIAVFAAAFGMIVSILAQTPAGATIVVVNIALYLIFSLVAKILKRG